MNMMYLERIVSIFVVRLCPIFYTISGLVSYKNRIPIILPKDYCLEIY